jgi:sterol desaturase/sphingolipid hydroxylase (fatty acid hydroxylase superfamily)
MDKNKELYPKREVVKETENEFVFGNGKISGYISAFLGFMSFLAVLAFQFPSYLTTAELRNAYDAHFLQDVLMYGMYASLFFGLLTFAMGASRKHGAIGVLFTILGFTCGGYTVEIGPVAKSTIAFGFDWLILAFLVSAVLFVFLEKVFPKYRDQIILRKEWKLDFFYFCINHLLITLLLLAGNYFVSNGFHWAISDNFKSWVLSLDLWVQVVLILVSADFVLYWTHRVFHKVNRLWRFHAIHHSVETMDWMASSRTHIVQTLVDRCLVLVPLYLVGVNKEALDIYISIAAFQAVYIHANVNVPLGPLKYFIVTPQYHHWHHSSQKPALDTNFSAHTPLFDKLFGTYHMPFKHWPAHYGTTSPLPKTFLGQFWYPFKRKTTKKRK